MVGKLFSYIIIIAIGFFFIDGEKLTYTDSRYLFFSIPILIISFGFHNVIPTLSHYLNRDKKRLKQAILGGVALSFCIYIFWQIVSLGILPVSGPLGILTNYKEGKDAAIAINQLVHFYPIQIFASLLAFFAILTSFLTQSLTLVHFLSDGMGINREEKENFWVILLTFLPPLLFSLFNPAVFYQALNFAGGICAVILFGIFPVLMIAIGKKRRKEKIPYPFLALIFSFALFILFVQITQSFGWGVFPTPKEALT